MQTTLSNAFSEGSFSYFDPNYIKKDNGLALNRLQIITWNFVTFTVALQISVNRSQWSNKGSRGTLFNLYSNVGKYDTHEMLGQLLLSDSCYQIVFNQSLHYFTEQ